MDLIWLIPLVPGIGAAINGLVGIRLFNKARPQSPLMRKRQLLTVPY
jgi:hypothetical protein